jgi:hypothetical protein
VATGARLYYADGRRALPSTLVEVRSAATEQAHRAALAPLAAMPTYPAGFWYQYRASNRPSPTTYRFMRQ